MSDDWRAPFGQPPGWYADPHRRGIQRWWDGMRWDEATRPTPFEIPQPVRSAHVPSWNWGSSGGEESDWQPAPRTQADLRQQWSPETRTDMVRLGRAADPGAANGRSFERVQGPRQDLNGGGRRRDSVTATPGRFQEPRNVPPGKTDPAAEESRSNGLDRLWLSAVFGLSLVLFTAGFALDDGVLRLIALTAALFFGVGTAPLQLSERASLGLRLCVATLVGLSVPVIVATAMVLGHFWHPSALAILLGAVTVGVHLVACRRILSKPLGTGIRRQTQLRARALLDASVVCSLLGTLLCLAGMIAMGHVPPPNGGFGFLPKAPPYWYLGLVFLVAGIILSRGKSELRPAFAAVLLLAALTLTPSVAYGMPRQTSASKHVSLVLMVLQTHNINSYAGIYQAYSGLFSAVAWLATLSRYSNAMAIATYWPFFIDLLAFVVLRFLFGRLTKPFYPIWLAITLVFLVNSIGMDYFSPQSVGFVLGIGMFGLAFAQGINGLSERGRMAILLLAGCAMAVTHELSPFIVGAVLVILVVFRSIRPWYISATVFVPAVLWAYLHKGYVEQFISLKNLGSLSNFEPPKQASTPTTAGLERLPIVGEASQALALGLLILIVIAGLAFIRNIRSRLYWSFGVSAGAGLIVIAGNSYGNEGIFRAVLFAIPWLAALGIQALPADRSRWLSPIYGAVLVALVGTYLASMFALDNADVIRPGDWQTMLTYQNTSAANSYLLNLTYGDEVMPGSIDSPLQRDHAVSWGNIITQAQANEVTPTAQDADDIAHQYYEYAKSNDGETGALYAAWLPGCVEYGADYGLETVGQAQAWRDALIASPDWKVVYSDDGSYLFRLVSNSSVPIKSSK